MRLPFGNKEQSPSPSLDHEKFQHGGEVVQRDEDLLVECPPHTTERRLMQKIDLHVIPFLVVLYLLAFLDRVNISNASVYGLNNDLKLRGDQYNVALLIFFVPYILLEIPSNILLKKFKPNVWLSLNMLLFGFVTIMQVCSALEQIFDISTYIVEGVSNELRRTIDRSLLPWRIRDRHVSGLLLSDRHVVSTP
jgi:hypothetical protein